jgi:uncharacterized protein (DUF885 family)
MPVSRTSLFLTLSLFGAGATAAPLLAQSAGVTTTLPAPAADGPANAKLRALYEAEWKWRQEQFGSNGRGTGSRGSRLPAVDARTQATRLAYWNEVLKQLDAIPRDQLSAEEQINADVFRAVVSGYATDIRYKNYEAPFNADTFFWTGLTPREGFATAAQYRDYIARMRDVPRYFDEQIANMRAGLKRGFTVPKVATTGRDKTAEPYSVANDTNPFWAPFAQMPDAIPAAERTQLQQEGRAALDERVVPAYAKLLRFLRTEYIPNARTETAANKLPDGDAYYQAMIEKFTTLTLTPEQIHAIGLKEVARIRAEMETTKKNAGFTGSMAEFMNFLRTDPQFYAKTPKELLANAAYTAKKADYQLKHVIGFLPRYRHGIVPVPPALAPIYTGGRGGLEACQMNTYNLPVRPLYTLPSLVVHECTPGHSFQAALALEAPARPEFRKQAGFSGYGEGWALYMEWLGTKTGIYETPYEDFGRLTYEMWRAARLVVDTGLHHYGWPRQKALDYFRENVALSEHEITTEIDRYIAWPGQALAYKLGEIQIRRQRAEAEAKLGAKFDQRIFHDVILQIGPVPLPTLERAVDAYIAAGGQNPNPWPGSAEGEQAPSAP